jgi:poly(3-hydroxybutyrate) depolymerase
MQYQAYDLYAKTANTLHDYYSLLHDVTSHPINPFAKTWIGRATNASLETAMRLTKRYEKLGFNIESVPVGHKIVPVCEEIVSYKPFCNLLHFNRLGQTDQEKVLLVAPLSGHHSTLLKGTVEALLPDHEVYITDWLDARDIPLSDGAFSFDCYVTYLIEFLEFLGPNTHVIAICQPAVQALIATAVLAQNNSEAIPKSLSLMAGPIDVSKNPTRVNDCATERSIETFKGFAISTVPYGYPGCGRKVYPGYMQLGGFLSMNMESHTQKFANFFQNLVFGEQEDADRFRAFYDEYLAVLDMPAEFYIETIERIFQNNEVARRAITYKGKEVDFDAIKNTALMTVEGANDDICGIGQTEAAHEVCRSIPKSKRKHHLQEGAGHYGIFSGSKFRKFIRPLITEFIHKHS